MKHKKNQDENHHDMEINIPVQDFFHTDEVRKGGGNIPRRCIGKRYAVLTLKQRKTPDFSTYTVLMGETRKPHVTDGRQN